MKASVASAIRELQKQPDGWVRIESVRRKGTRLVLSLVLRRGKSGPRVGGWNVVCVGTREIHVSDLDGGGMRLYGSSHPAARQYATGAAQLRCQLEGRGNDILGTLVAAHVAAVDDWIPVDRYLPMDLAATGELVVRGPAFLLRAYSKALKAVSLIARVSAVKTRRSESQKPRVLHLGNSFVVADRFELAR